MNKTLAVLVFGTATLVPASLDALTLVPCYSTVTILKEHKSSIGSNDANAPLSLYDFRFQIRRAPIVEPVLFREKNPADNSYLGRIAIFYHETFCPITQTERAEELYLE